MGCGKLMITWLEWVGLEPKTSILTDKWCQAIIVIRFVMKTKALFGCVHKSVYYSKLKSPCSDYEGPDVYTMGL